METKKGTLQNFILLTIIFFGAFLRFYNLGFAALSVRHDETWRALIASSGDWLGSLLHNVYAPLTPGFIAIPHYLAGLFGNTELILRFPGALYGALSLILLFLIVKKIYNETAATIAVFLLAFHPEFLIYSRYFRQYSLDIFIALIAAYLTERTIEKESLFNYVLFAAFALLGMFFSLTVIFIYPAIFLTLFIHNLKKTDHKAAVFYFILAVLIAIFLVGYYMAVLKPQIIPELKEWWSGDFPASAGPLPMALLWTVERTYRIFWFYVFNFYNPVGKMFMDLVSPFFVVLAAIGLFRSYRMGNYRPLFYCFVPLFLTLLFSLFALWPYGPSRVNFFYFPFLFIPVSIGAAYLFFESEWSKRKRMLSSSLAILLLLVFLPFGVISEIIRPIDREDIRPGILEIFKYAGKDDAVFVYPPSAFKYYYFYYSPFRSLRKTINEGNIFYVGEEAIFAKRQKSDERVLKRLSGVFREGRRAWVVFPLIKEDGARTAVKHIFDKLGKEELSVKKERAWVGLYLSKYPAVK